MNGNRKQTGGQLEAARWKPIGIRTGNKQPWFRLKRYGGGVFFSGPKGKRGKTAQYFSPSQGTRDDQLEGRLLAGARKNPLRAKAVKWGGGCLDLGINSQFGLGCKGAL